MKPVIRRILLLGTWLLALAAPVQSQFVHFSMNVESELSAQVVQNMDFGPLVTNSGTYQIERGSPGMGIFQITSLNNQTMLVTLDIPEYLAHSDPAAADRLPVSLEASYTTDGNQDALTAQPFSGNTALLSTGMPNGNSAMAVWQSAYIYIYGRVDVGDIQEGQYSGTLVLNVEYY